MSGIMEQILAELQSINASIRAQGHAPAMPAATPAPAAATDPFAAAPAAAPPPPAPTEVSEEQIMALIEPHLTNATIKSAMQGVLQTMGIARLPDTTPEQRPTLYRQFQAIIAQHSAAAPAVSII